MGPPQLDDYSGISVTDITESPALQHNRMPNRRRPQPVISRRRRLDSPELREIIAETLEDAWRRRQPGGGRPELAR